MKQRWRKFVKAFFKKIEKEGTSNMSTEWLEFAELILSNEMSHEKTSGYQKEMESLQFDFTELPATDGLELDYFEYKLNEILDTQTTYIESKLLLTAPANVTTNSEEKLYLDEKEAFLGQQLKADFKEMSAQILKYCSYCLEQPKLLYSIVYKVNIAHQVLVLLENHVCDKDFFISRLLAQFLVYLTRHSAVLLKRIKSELSKDHSNEHKLNLSDEKNEVKIGKAVDKLMDNIRIFSCFIADLCIYYYNLDNLMFLCQTATGDSVMIGQNLFLTSELLANYFIDILFRSDSSNSIVEMAKYQSRDQNELLSTHVGLLKKVGCWSDLGLPPELLRDKSDFLAPDEAKSRQNLVIEDTEMKEMYRNNEQLDTDGDQSVVVDEFKPEKQDSTQLDTNAKNSKNQSKEKTETLGEFNPFYSEKSDNDIHQLTFIDDDAKIKQGNPSFSLFREYTVIQGLNNKPGNDQTLNETQDNLLILLNLKEDLILKKDRDLFPLAIEVFKQLPKAQTPTKKLHILTSSVVCALQEMRQIYSEKNPDTEVKFKVTQEMIVSILIYIILKAGFSDVLAEYKVMKVYFLLNKDYNHNTLIYLLKSAIKSINKLGVYHTRHSV